MDDIPVFPVMVVIGLTVFGLVFIAGQEFDFDTEEPEDSMTLVSKSYGQVGSSAQDQRIVNLGSFTVGQTRGDVQAYRNQRRDIENGLFSSDHIVVEYNASQPQSGKVEFEVLGKEGNGAVFIDVNGERIFEEQMVASQKEVEIPAEKLDIGVNRIVIGTTRGGVLSSASYALRSVEVTVNDRKFHDYRSSFRIYDYELEDFVSSELEFSIADSVKTEPLELFVNDVKLYSRPQVRISPEEIEMTRQNADLVPGFNSIRFQTEGDAYYKIENAQVTMRYVGATSTRTIREEFELSDSELDFVQDEETSETISFDYQRMLPSQRPMKIELNGNSYSLNPENGENELEIPAEDFEEENVLTIESNTTYQLNDFQMTSERVEE